MPTQQNEEQQSDIFRFSCKNPLFCKVKIELKEAEINFKPTYRRLRDDSKIYSNKKFQPPSWTDRIFFRASPNHFMKVLEYNSKEFQYGRFKYDRYI